MGKPIETTPLKYN